MKKIFSILFATALIILSAVPAFADESYDNISLGIAEDGTVLSENEVLSPYREYDFTIYLTKNGEKIPLSNQLGDGLKITCGIISGRDSILSCEILRGNENYYLKLKIRPLSYTEQNKAEIQLNIIGDNFSLSKNYSFKTGFKSVSDDYINNLNKGEFIRINNDRPLFTASQLKKLSELNKGGDVTFKGNNFTYTVRLRGAPSSNMYYTEDIIDEIDRKYPESNLKYLTFPAGPQFTNSKLVLDVSDLEYFSGNFHLYSYYKNRLTEIPCEYDSEALTLTVDITGLGSFIISDVPLVKGAGVITKPSKNPNTGYRDFTATAVTGLISSIMGAMLIIFRRQCKDI